MELEFLDPIFVGCCSDWALSAHKMIAPAEIVGMVSALPHVKKKKNRKFKREVSKSKEKEIGKKINK